MEKWITRICAALCAGGGLGLFWVAGVILALLQQQHSSMQSAVPFSGKEYHILAVAFIAGAAVAWGALHLLALADKEDSPRLYRTVRICYFILIAAVTAFGASWAAGRFF